MKKALIESYKCFFSGTPGRIPLLSPGKRNPDLRIKSQVVTKPKMRVLGFFDSLNSNIEYLWGWME